MDVVRLFYLESKSERDAGRALISHFPSAIREKVVNLAGKTDWNGLFDVISDLDTVVTPDTGTMHLAAHLGIPVQAVFLSSAWCFETGPYGLGHTIWQSVFSCAPCVESQPCPHEVACLEPFASRDFLRVLSSGKFDRDIPGITGLHSGFDELGATYFPFCGKDPYARERSTFRNFLSMHLGIGCPEEANIPQSLADMMYLEKDWMTRPYIGPLPQEGVHG